MLKRSWIVVGLIAFGPSARSEPAHEIRGKNVDGWIKVLRSGLNGDRLRAARVLSHFGAEAKDAVPDLIEMLRDAHSFETSAAIEALGRIGPDAAPAVPLIIKQFVKEGCPLGWSPILRNVGTAFAPAGIGESAVPALVEVLEGPNPKMRPCAVEALGLMGPRAKAAVPALIRALRSEKADRVPDDVLRRFAILALGKIGPDAKDAVPALDALFAARKKGDLYGDTSLIVRALDGIGVSTVPKLLEMILNEEEDWAARELARLDDKAKSAIPTLRKALTDPRLAVRIDSAVALVCIDPTAIDALPILIDAIDNHRDEWESHDVTWALARLGPIAARALPTLIALVMKGIAIDDEVKAMYLIDPEGKECVPALIAALKNKKAYISYTASECLGLLGPKAKAAIPDLVETITRDFDEDIVNEDPHMAAADALRRIGPAAESAIPKLIDAVKDEESDAAARLLGSFGPAAKAAVPALIEAIQIGEDENNLDHLLIQRESALALGRIGPAAKAAAPILRRMIEKGTSIDPWAVVALVQLSPDAKSIAENRLERSDYERVWMNLMGAMGRTNFEADSITRRSLEILNLVVSTVKYEGDDTRNVEGYFEAIADYGVAGRAAIARMNELRRHRNPWIRLWARETLGRIDPEAHRTPAAPSKNVPIIK